MNNQDYIEEIRQKSLCEANLNRCEKRNLCRNGKRSNYESVLKKLEVPNIEEFQKLCLYFSREKKKKYLEKIHLGLARGSQYITHFLNTNGALYALTGSLSGINTKLQMHALYCVINLGLGTPDERLLVCSKVGPYLVALLGGEDHVIQSLCWWAFGNLCEGSEDICSLVQSQGFEGAVTNAIFASDSFFTYGFYALNSYFEVLPHRMKVVCNPPIIKEVVTNMLPSNTDDGELTGDLCWCLFIISSDRMLCSCLIDYGIVSTALKILYELANHNCLEKRIFTSLVRVLTNCVAVINREAIKICYNVHQFVSIVRFIMKSSYTHLHDETIQLISNIVNGAMAQSVTGENILEDSNFRQQIEPILQTVLAARQYSLTPECQFGQYYSK